MITMMMTTMVVITLMMITMRVFMTIKLIMIWRIMVMVVVIIVPAYFARRYASVLARSWHGQHVGFACGAKSVDFAATANN